LQMIKSKKIWSHQHSIKFGNSGAMSTSVTSHRMLHSQHTGMLGEGGTGGGGGQ
jgi:hypothetical protein